MEHITLTSAKELAKQLGHDPKVIEMYEALKDSKLPYNNSDLAELDIIYFLYNILWSTHFELIAKIVIDGDFECRLEQWQKAIQKLKNTEPTAQ